MTSVTTFLMPFFAAQSAIGTVGLRQGEAGAHDEGRGLGDGGAWRRPSRPRHLGLGGDRRGGKRQRRQAEAGEHADLVVDDQLLREALGHVRRRRCRPSRSARSSCRRPCRRSAACRAWPPPRSAGRSRRTARSSAGSGRSSRRPAPGPPRCKASATAAAPAAPDKCPT